METSLDPKKHKPLLAATASTEDLDRLQYPLLVSPKIDGIRCLMIDGTAFSRSLKYIRNKHVQDFARFLLLEHNLNLLDGELTAGNYKTKFQDTTSEIMSFDGGDDFTYNVFDTQERKPFSNRLKTIARRECKINYNGGRLDFVEQHEVTNKEQVTQLLDTFLEQGYEGAMLRRPNAPYKHGRSTLKEGILLKLKPFLDAEATIIGLLPLLKNNNEASVNELGHTHRSSSLAGKNPLDMLGSIRCITSKGIQFNIGTGFTEEERITLWHMPNIIGTRVHYKYQPYGVKEAPRCPVFLNLVKGE
jgi:DNA ligase-1